MNNKKQYQTMVLLNEERKKKFEYICQEESRNKTNMISFLIDYYYQRLQKKKLKENEVIIKNPIKENYEDTFKLIGVGLEEMGNNKEYKKPPSSAYKELMKLKGSKIWEGNLEEMRKERSFDNDNG